MKSLKGKQFIQLVDSSDGVLRHRIEACLGPASEKLSEKPSCQGTEHAVSWARLIASVEVEVENLEQKQIGQDKFIADERFTVYGNFFCQGAFPVSKKKSLKLVKSQVLK